MGLFSNIISSVSSVYLGVKEAVVGQSNQVVSPNTKLTTSTANFLAPFVPAVKQATIATTASVAVSSGLVSTVATAAKTAAAPITSSISKSYTSSFATAPLKTVAYTAAAGVGGLVVAKSTTAKQSIANLPSSVDIFTTNTAKFIDNPTLETAKTIGQESPILTGAILAGTALVVGKAASGIISGVSNTIATNKNTAAIENSMVNPQVQTLPKTSTSDLPKALAASTPQSLVPITPSTQVLGKSASSTSIKKYKRSTSKPSSYNQRMSINIFNQSKTLYTRGFRG
jgi:hypothetical protein